MESTPFSREQQELPIWQEFADMAMKDCRRMIAEGVTHEAFYEIQLRTTQIVNSFLARGAIDDYATLQRYFYDCNSPLHLIAMSREEFELPTSTLVVGDLFTAEPREYMLTVYLDDGIDRLNSRTQQRLVEDKDENIRRLSGQTGMLGKIMDTPCTDPSHSHNSQWS